MTGLDDLRRWFHAAGRVVLGYSGGVDSSLLAVVGADTLGSDFLAVIGRSASFPEREWRAARALASRFGIAVHEVPTAELSDPDYRKNPTDRCYFCKRELWQVLGRVARERGFDVVIDGTHADDLEVGGHRPGLRAGQAAGVRSPLAELGWTKDAIRRAAGHLGLPVAAAPSSPCLASRIRYGLEVTPSRLRQVERAETFLRSLGVEGDLRVRHHGGLARVEVTKAMLPLVLDQWDRIAAELGAIGFERVERDPAGYRRGSLLEA